MKLTREQRVALKRVYDRQPVYQVAEQTGIGQETAGRRLLQGEPGIEARRMTYREFRRTVQPFFGCILVNWCGMILGIETDGHTHS